MQVSLRNGVVQYQYSPSPLQPTYLTKTSTVSGYNININTDEKDLIVTVSQGAAEYLLTWTGNINAAWSFTDSQTYYLYIDVDRRTGAITYGSTIYPISYGTVLPSTPNVKQNFFNISDNTTYEWTGSLWVPKTRVFVGSCTPASVIPVTGCLTGTVYQYRSGSIVFTANGNPVVKNDKTFLTTEDNLAISGFPGNAVTLEHASVFATARANMGAPRFVKYDNGFIEYAQPADAGKQLLFVLTEPVNTGETTNVLVSGKITNTTWNWPSSNTPIWCGPNGTLVTTDPALLDTSLTVSSPIAHSLDGQTILMSPSYATGSGSGNSTGSSFRWVDVDSGTYIAQAFEAILIDNTNGDVTINLPTTAVTGDVVAVALKPTSMAHIVTINPSSDNIMGVNESLIIDVPSAALQCVKRDEPYGWAIIPFLN